MTDKTNNKRDRSEQAEARRITRNITMDFTGFNGLMRSLVSYKHQTIYQGKPKRGWAAKWRKLPFKNYLDDELMEKARRRHKWRQKELQAG